MHELRIEQLSIYKHNTNSVINGFVNYKIDNE
jgi:hypothetical protein